MGMIERKAPSPITATDNQRSSPVKSQPTGPAAIPITPSRANLSRALTNRRRALLTRCSLSTCPVSGGTYAGAKLQGSILSRMSTLYV